MMVLALMSSDSQWSGTLPEINSDMVQLRNLGLTVRYCLGVAHLTVYFAFVHVVAGKCINRQRYGR